MASAGTVQNRRLVTPFPMATMLTNSPFICHSSIVWESKTHWLCGKANRSEWRTHTHIHTHSSKKRSQVRAIRACRSYTKVCLHETFNRTEETRLHRFCGWTLRDKDGSSPPLRAQTNIRERKAISEGLGSCGWAYDGKNPMGGREGGKARSLFGCVPFLQDDLALPRGELGLVVTQDP